MTGATLLPLPIFTDNQFSGIRLPGDLREIIIAGANTLLSYITNPAVVLSSRDVRRFLLLGRKIRVMHHSTTRKKYK